MDILFTRAAIIKPSRVLSLVKLEDIFMPLARISVPSSLSPAKVRALADAVHHGLVTTCNVPDKERFQLVSCYPSGSMILDPTIPNVCRTAEACVIEILFLEGRTTEQKARLFQTIAARALDAGFCNDDIMIALTENAPTDWSLGRGEPFEKDHRSALP
jgi:phenylpyruvate tautomerase PptA (4-oxalocrotonate tautomerase family)